MIGADRMLEIMDEQNRLGVPLEQRMEARGVDYEELVKVADITCSQPFPSEVIFTASFELGYLCALEEAKRVEQTVPDRPDDPEEDRRGS